MGLGTQCSGWKRMKYGAWNPVFSMKENEIWGLESSVPMKENEIWGLEPSVPDERE